MEQELRERKLRQQIHAIRVKKFHWPLDGFKFIMNGLGFGESLTALHEDKLLELKSLMIKYRKHGRPLEFNYDRQGKFMHALMKSAGWTEKDLRAFMIIHYQKTHWNLLDSRERRAIIAMLQKYANKQTDKQSNQNTVINPKEDSHE